MDVEILIPVTFFAMIVAIVWLTMHFGLKRRVEIHQTLRLALEKGQPLPPETLEALTRMGNPLADLRRGIIFVAVAGAFAAVAGIVSSPEPDAVHPLLGVAVFPLFVGLAFLGLHFFANDKKPG